MGECSPGYSRKMLRIPMVPPIDGKGASKCLALYAAADNAAWNKYDQQADECEQDANGCSANSCIAALNLEYIAAWTQAVSDYYACMNIIP